MHHDHAPEMFDNAFGHNGDLRKYSDWDFRYKAGLADNLIRKEGFDLSNKLRVILDLHSILLTMERHMNFLIVSKI